MLVAGMVHLMAVSLAVSKAASMVVERAALREYKKVDLRVGQ